MTVTNAMVIAGLRDELEAFQASNAIRGAEVERLRAELSGYVEANRYMKGELDDALEDARKYTEAQAEIARLREALTVIAYPTGVLYHEDAVTQARAALAEVPK